MIDRRSFLRAALFVAAAPIIVRASSLMPVRALTADVLDTEFVTEILLWKGIERYSFGIAEWRSSFGSGGVWNELPRL